MPACAIFLRDRIIDQSEMEAYAALTRQARGATKQHRSSIMAPQRRWKALRSTVWSGLNSGTCRRPVPSTTVLNIRRRKRGG